VGTLEVVQAIDLALAVEMACGIGKGLETLEKVAERRFDMPFKCLAVAAERFALSGLDTGKTQTVAQAGRLSRSSLFCRHFLHAYAPKPMMPDRLLNAAAELSHGVRLANQAVLMRRRTRVTRRSMIKFGETRIPARIRYGGSASCLVEKWRISHSDV
jgi:hypothetical protein